MITKLENPKTENYLNFKSFVLSGEFPWFYSSGTLDEEECNDVPFFGYSFLARSGNPNYCTSPSPYTNEVSNLFLEILFHNNIDIHLFYRMNANLVMPTSSPISTLPHTDHDYPHHNMIVYLTSSGGPTIVEGERFFPEEDDVIIFDGSLTHFHKTPLNKRRIVLVSTFLMK